MSRSLTTLLFVFSWGIGAGAFASDTSATPPKVFRAGACAVDITPPFDRVIRNGWFLEASVAELLLHCHLSLRERSRSKPRERARQRDFRGNAEIAAHFQAP